MSKAHEALRLVQLAIERADWAHHGDMIEAVRILGSAVEDQERWRKAANTIEPHLKLAKGYWNPCAPLGRQTRREQAEFHINAALAALDAARTPNHNQGT